MCFHKVHMHRKAQSRLEKEKFKAICKSDPSVVAVAFDLQQVLCCQVKCICLVLQAEVVNV